MRFLIEVMRFCISALNIKSAFFPNATRNFNFLLECEKDKVCIIALVPPVSNAENIFRLSFNNNYLVCCQYYVSAHCC